MNLHLFWGIEFVSLLGWKLQGGDEMVVEEISCGGVSEEDCLERRTLLAHTDYIYTQKENP